MAYTPSETLLTNQEQLWDKQHAQRGGQHGLEGDHLVNVPNKSAILLNGLLRPSATIAEVGSANGRDARYWANEGHTVHCMDFSTVALGQLVTLAERQGVADRIQPIHFDANTGQLPEEVGEIDSFYARSALHVDDETLMKLFEDVDKRMRMNGIILVEGKSTNDAKIARSIDLGNGLAIDPEEDGHLRRIWTPESLVKVCSAFGWTALRQDTVGESWVGTDATFLRLVAIK